MCRDEEHLRKRECGPCDGSEALGGVRGGATSHEGRVVIVNEGDAGRTDGGLCAEQLLVGPDIPMTSLSLSGGPEYAERDVGTHEQQPPKTRKSIKE